MKRTILAATATVPLLALAAGGVSAQVQISTSTTAPVATATAAAGHPADVAITASGSINPTVSAPALTLNSDNSVSNAGSISFSNVNGATGIRALGGFRGEVVNTSGITVGETYTPTVNSSTGLADGPFAQGLNRIGIDVAGPGIFDGSIVETGSITVQGNDSQGILIDAPITGGVRTITVTTTNGTSTVANGLISITGDRTVAFEVSANGAVGGNITIPTISALGVGAKGVAIDGNVGGTVEIANPVVATAYRTTTRPTNPTAAALFTSTQLRQGGVAVDIGADVAGGVFISAPPPILSSTIADQDNNGVPDSLQSRGVVTSYGSSPALQVGAVGRSVTLGPVGTGNQAYGLVIDGGVIGNGVFDPYITPAFPGLAPATGVSLGVAGGGPVNIVGGVRVGGVVYAQSYQADSTAIDILPGVTGAAIVNGGSIFARSTQINNDTTLLPVHITGIRIAAGSNISTITNTGGINADITGDGGAGGAAGAILDRSGSITTITNNGTIAATLTQTLASNPMPGTTTSIDISAGTAPQSITQFAPGSFPTATVWVSSNTYTSGSIVTYLGGVYQAINNVGLANDPRTYPALWRQIGATVPSIQGSIFFGSGGSTLTVQSGLVFGSVIDLGAGVNTLTVNGDSLTNVSGELKDEGGHLTLNVLNGTLSDTNPITIHADSVNVGAKGVLFVAADPVAGTNTDFITSGASTFAQGASVGVTLASIQYANSHDYTVVQTVPGQGTLTAGTFPTGLINNAPFLYTAFATFDPAVDPAVDPSRILLTVTRKTPEQMNLNNAQAAALDAVLLAIPRDAKIQATILNQTTETGFKLAYDQLLPDQGQGLFEAIDAASQSIAGMIATPPDAGIHTAGNSLWLQEVNARIERSGIETQGSSSKLLGLVGGFERAGFGGGALGVSLGYLNTQETNNQSAVGQQVVSSLAEIGLYYRRSVGGLSIASSAAAGYSWYTGTRRFVSVQASNTATSSWSGGFLTGHMAVRYEIQRGSLYFGPALYSDYTNLHEGQRVDVGGGPGFDLTVAPRTSTRLSSEALLVVGNQWGREAWVRAELRGGYRRILAGSIADTVANFEGQAPFTLAPDPSGGWATIGFSVKSGSQYSYLALEGDADFRSGEQRYDLLLAGRSAF